MNKTNNKQQTKKLVGMAMFAALAYAVTFVFRIPVMFLTFDAKDAIITIAALMYGPLAGVAISLIVALIEALSISGTGVYGFIMNFASSATFSFVAALIYKYKRNATGAIIALYTATVSMAAVMTVLNIFVTPYYMMGPDLGLAEAKASVMKLIPTLMLPFNFAKALLNSALAMILYKPITVAMRRAKLLGGKGGMSVNRSSVSIYIAAVATLIFSGVIFIILKK